MPPHQDRLLHALTDQQLAAAQPRSRASAGRLVELEVAAWLHLPGLSDLPVSLLVSYRDGEHLREVTVDHGRIDCRQRILLSGVARLPIERSLHDVELRLRSAVPPAGLRVEELFVQPVT